MINWLKTPKFLILGSLTLLLAAMLACGSSATSTPIPEQATAVPGITAAVPTSAPSSGKASAPAPTAVPTKAPQAAPKPSGTLNVGQKELGPYVGNPKMIGNPQIFLNSAIPITETLGMAGFDSGAVVPMLAESWDISADAQTWTFHIRKGVQFHKGFGEMTAEDVVFSHRQIAESDKHARSANAAQMFFAEDGNQTTPDNYTWVVDMGQPFSEVPLYELIGTPRAVGAWLARNSGMKRAKRRPTSTPLPPGRGKLMKPRPANSGG